MALMEPDRGGDKTPDLVDYERRLAEVMQTANKLPMSSHFTFVQQCNNIDTIGLNPKTGRHEMTDLDIKELKLMFKQLMLQKIQVEKMSSKMLADFKSEL